MKFDTVPRAVRIGVVIALLVAAAAVPVAVAAIGSEDEPAVGEGDAREITPGEEEPNDGMEDAQEVTLRAEVTGELTSGDVDWFRFTAERGKAITVTGSTDGVGTTNFDLVDSNGNTLDGRSGLENASGEVGATSTYAGTYYLRVERRFTDRGGEYSFTVETSDTDAFEPNEVRDNATQITDEEEVVGELTISDADWFNVTAQRGDAINISAFGDSNGTTNFQLFARNGTLITRRDGVSGRSARINATAPYTGEYSIRVAPRFEGRYGAAYNLTVDVPGEPPSDTNETRAGGTPADDGTGGGLPVVPLVAGIAVVLVLLLVGWRYREEDDESR